MRFLIPALAVSLALASFAGCSADPAELPNEEDAGSSSGKGPTTGRADGGRTRDGGPREDGGGAEPETPNDGGPLEACEAEMAMYRACGSTDNLLCPADSFVAWCRLNNAATESAQRIAGRAACTEAPRDCNPGVRAQCIYDSYNRAEMSPAQQRLLTRYCNTCESNNPSACEERTLRYTGQEVDSIFLAAWELAEDLVAQIDDECIDRAAAAGDAAACATVFDRCAGDVWGDALPDCP